VVVSERWPATGLPPNPGGWITTTARNRAIDRLRREASRHARGRRRPRPGRHHLFHATRAELLARLDRNDEARVAYGRALALASNAAEHAFLEDKQRSLPS
jgi:predicted RNA polymerase sigma factor